MPHSPSSPMIYTLGLLLYVMVAFPGITSADDILVVFNVEEKLPVQKTNKNFLNVAIDTSQMMKNFSNIDIRDDKLVKLMKPLAPGYLRIGGNMASSLLFDPNVTITLYSDADYEMRKEFTMSATVWDDLNNLAKRSGLKILFDLNYLTRLDGDKWDPSNAEELIKYSAKRNYSLDWELGNEPNLYPKHFNYTPKPEQMAEDFSTCRNLLNSYPIYNTSLLVGPATTRPTTMTTPASKILSGFVKHGKDYVDAVTWHHYYFDGREANISHFMNPDVFNLLDTQITNSKEILKEAGAKKKSMWLGETSSAFGGGAPGLSNTFVATFIWLDKLGLAARQGIDLVIRQALFGGNYSLLDSDLNPLPDWWLSIIYKKLVGRRVAPCKIFAPAEVRLYCHCARKVFQGTKSVVLFGLNVKDSAENVKIAEYAGDVWEYRLSAKYLTSKKMQLNDKTLSVTSDGILSRISPVKIKSNNLKIHGHSLVFWIIPMELASCSLE
ncbi:hypothetical protein PPYR_06851 [Photinus pyralis]|uniref:Heparanase n=2 Tax=Photinus pyralis TaxID=7054 RepID=A0A5N4ANT8_PHOPY|nr:heparanase-like isoform X1 [Photinus pyralis]KAB0798971.1 hypothetical protein PPYR_06851 [Photinus pyralis]